VLDRSIPLNELIHRTKVRARNTTEAPREAAAWSTSGVS
jgi:hypothetical protein